MLTKLSVRSFQSLRKVDLTLERFTVVVGASSSGKSALFRALRLLVSNARGTAYVTRGQKLAAVSVETDDGHLVTVERGEGISRYKLDGTEYSKAGVAVPEPVTTALRIQAEDPLNFAGQFDRPFLLDDSGGQVARVLGELTNVTRIFDAVREANRRRLALAGTLKTRTIDLANLQTQAERFAGLKDRRAALDAAEAALGRARELHMQVGRLGDLVASLDVAEVALARAHEALPVVPDLALVEQSHARLAAFQALVAQMNAHATLYRTRVTEIEVLGQQETELHEEFHRTLKEAGVCPTCGADTSELQVA